MEKEESIESSSMVCAVDGSGILYVTECDNDTVSMFTSNGNFLDIIIGDSDGSSFKFPFFILSDQSSRLCLINCATSYTTKLALIGVNGHSRAVPRVKFSANPQKKC